MLVSEKLCLVLGKLPLLFVVDSILKGTFLDFTDVFGVCYQPRFWVEGNIIYQPYEMFIFFLWFLFIFGVMVIALISVCCPPDLLLEVYGCCLGLCCLVLSYYTNKKLFSETEVFKTEENNVQDDLGTDSLEQTVKQTSVMSIIFVLVTQVFVVVSFDQACRVDLPEAISRYARYPIDIILLVSFTFPILTHLILIDDSITHDLSLTASVVFPLGFLMVHSFSVMFKIIKIAVPPVRNIQNHVRELGFDGIIMQITEMANLSWLLRAFFFSHIVNQILCHKVISNTSEIWDANDNAFSLLKLLAVDILDGMCGTILSVMGMAAAVSVVSGWCLRIVYHIIGATEEEESVQPAVSGFLFVLLALQTGITGLSRGSRLQLLLQNCMLLLVANQHFVQGVTADMILKASADDVAIKKHVRPMLPYAMFLLFPFIVVARLWNYSFRVSWLLAISTFSIELIIKSTGTLIIYTLNMLHSRTHYLRGNLDDLLFYIRAVCGSLEFVCGIFLFVNGAYIFFFESGGIIRLVMMIIHFYCNIYQTALKGWASYKLRQSAWGKINKLQAASQEQLDENDDICSICYQEMSEAVVIKCSHVFHKGCLQKWFTIQDWCPLCHESMEDEVPENVNNNEELIMR